MDSAIGVAVKKAPHAILQLANTLRGSGDQRPGQFLVIEVCTPFDGVTEVLVQGVIWV